MINHEMGLCGIFIPEEYPEICRLVSELLEEISNQSKDILYHKEMCAGLLYQLLLCLARRSANLPKTEKIRANAITALEPAINAISQGIHSGEIPSISELAQISNMSVSYFRKKSILDVSLETGFHSISAFNRCFKAHTGISPTQFRQKYHNPI